MIINYNGMASNALRQLNVNSGHQAKSMAKLSSGLRINSAADDAAGLAISEKMKGQIRGLDQASRNAQDGISMTQTAEGALNETTDILQRMRELAVQGSNDTNTSSDRDQVQKEMDQLTSEINRIGNTTEFNTQKLLNGNANAGAATATALQTNGTSGNISITTIAATTTKNELITISFTGTTYSIDQHDGNGPTTQTTFPAAVDGLTLHTTGVTPKAGDSWSIMATAKGAGKSVTLQIGANQSQSMSLNIGDMRAAALGLTGTAGTTGFTATNDVTDGTSNTASEAGLDVSNATNSASAITVIQGAIDRVSSERAKLGSYENRLDHTINNLSTSSQNINDAQSRIADVDMASEMMNQSKYSVLAQAAQAMLAQANQQPQQVLQLLRG